MGLPKGNNSGKKEVLGHTVLGKIGVFRYFVIKNHRFCFDIPQMLVVVLISFQQNIKFYCNSDSILVIQKITYFCNDFMFMLWCEFFVISKFDEINCNVISGVLYNVF